MQNSRAQRSMTLCLSLVVLCLATAGAFAEFRTWTDATGEHRVEAEFVELRGENVVLRRRDGKTISVPLNRLSRKGQLQVRRQAAEPFRSSANAANQQQGSQRQESLARATFDWPQWRGVNRDGVSPETGLLDQWPSEGPPLLWQASGLGGGYSSVAVSDGRIFTMGKFGDETRLIALQESDGQQLWATEAGGGGAPNCTPTADGKLVYSLSFGGDLLCAETATGEQVWSKNFSHDFGGRMMSGWGYSESPLVDDNKLVCTPGSSRAMLAALNKETGETIWTTPMPREVGNQGKDGAAYSSIVIGHGAGVRQYVQLIGRGVVGVDTQSGKLLWGYNRVANSTANVPTPIVQDDFVFCSSGYGTGAALLRLVGSRGRITPQEVYFKSGNELQNHHGGMILVGDHVYMGHGHNNGFPVCVDLRSGRDAWRPGRGPGGGSAAVAYADGHLYFRYQDATMALIEATPNEYRLKGEFKLAVKNGNSWPHPVIANGRLYLRDQNDLLCYDIRRR